MKRNVVKTEYRTINADDVIFEGTYAWVEEDKTLYRCLAEDETETQVALIIKKNKQKIKACRVMECNSAEEAFSLMRYNIIKAKESLVSLMIKLDEDPEEIERMKEEFDKLL